VAQAFTCAVFQGAGASDRSAFELSEQNVMLIVLALIDVVMISTFADGDVAL